VALVAAFAALITAAISTWLSFRTERLRQNHESHMNSVKSRQERELAEWKGAFDTNLKNLESDLTELQAARNARRDYEYEARKRLYAEVEPVLFQLMELSEGALYRIYSIARTARDGDLDPASKSWLGSDQSYYFRSTIYYLFVPMAAIKLLQRRITFVDLALETRMNAKYALAKRLLKTFTDDFEVATLEPALPYSPNADNADAMREKEPAKYCRQGVFIGHIENVVEAMIHDGGTTGSSRIKSFGEIETDWWDKNSSLAKSLPRIIRLLLNFHPARRPVLWRILIVQAHLYDALVKMRENKLHGDTTPEKPLRILPKEAQQKLDWRNPQKKEVTDKELVVPFAVAQRYFERHLGELFQPETS